MLQHPFSRDRAMSDGPSSSHHACNAVYHWIEIGVGEPQNAAFPTLRPEAIAFFACESGWSFLLFVFARAKVKMTTQGLHGVKIVDFAVIEHFRYQWHVVASIAIDGVCSKRPWRPRTSVICDRGPTLGGHRSKRVRGTAHMKPNVCAALLRVLRCPLDGREGIPRSRLSI